MDTYIIVDLRTGGVDGYYKSKKMAVESLEFWCEALGHSHIVLAKIVIGSPNENEEIGKDCFLGDRGIG